MPEPHDPVDHDPVGGDPINHDPIADAVQRARHDVAPIGGAALVDSVRAAQLRHQRKNRRAVGSIAGVAAVLILVAIGLVSFGNSTPDQVATRPTAHGTDNGRVGQQRASQAAPGMVTVDPSTGLIDGQTVAVTAHGFDAGTTVTFFECLERTAARPNSSTSPQPSTILPDDTHVRVPTTSGNTSSAADGSSTLVSDWICAYPGADAPARPVGQQQDAPSTSITPEPTVDHTFEYQPTIAKSTMQVSTTIHDLTGISTDGGMSLPPVPDSVTCDNQPSVSGTKDPCSLPTWTSPNGQNSYFLIVARGTIDGRITVRQGPPLIFKPSDSNPSTGPADTASATSVPVTTLPNGPNCPSNIPTIAVDTPRGVGPLVGFTPTAAKICAYPVYPPNSPSCSVGAATLQCNSQGMDVTDSGTLVPLVAELDALPTVSAGQNLACTADAGPTVQLTLTAPGHRATITTEFFGCGQVSDGASLHQGAKSLTLLKKLIGP